MNTLRLAHSAINDVLRTDIIGRLPCHLQRRILSYLDVRLLCRCLGVSRQWQRIIDGDAELWRYKIEQAGYKMTQEEHVQQQHEEMMNRGSYGYKMIYQRHLRIHLNWRHNRAHRMQLPGHSSHVVTCLQFDEDKIITASDDQTINLYDIRTGQLLRTFYGHEGGVWALQYVGNTLVTGATDRTIRVWDIDTGQCRHVFHGHSGTVRCLTIVMPVKNPNTGIYEPQRPLIVSGSRDHSVRVWDLPQSTNITATTTTCLQHENTTMKNEHHHRRSHKDTRASAMNRLSKYMPQDESTQPIVPDMSDLPMRSTTTATDKTIHVHVLLGHREAVRALAAHGNTLVSGSYDGSVRIWHLEQGRCIHQLLGHSGKVYSVVIDAKRNRCISGSMDSFVRVWNMETGVCEHVLGGHTALVGLLGLSASHLVSAAADQSLRVWSPDTGDRQHVLLGHEAAITSFQNDDHKVISGSEGGIKMWDIKTGKLMHNLVNNVSGVWRVAFDERRCIAAVKGDDDVTRLEIFDYDVY
ncbi:WD40 repeat-like protein [Lichtheimia hyalospora FSU 10163]|nr:WD40 repeat-like protein [Lichtheimia hyalospora FSU 10163]